MHRNSKPADFSSKSAAQVKKPPLANGTKRPLAATISELLLDALCPAGGATFVARGAAAAAVATALRHLADDAECRPMVADRHLLLLLLQLPLLMLLFRLLLVMLLLLPLRLLLCLSLLLVGLL